MDLAALRGQFAYQPMLLGTIALLTSAALSFAHQATAPAIAAAEARDLNDSLAEVLPRGFADNDLLKDTQEIRDGETPVIVHRARRGSTVNGAVFRINGRGYAGEIALMMAVDRDGKVLGVRVIKHAETPGLGDKIEAKKDPWVTTFNGKTLTQPTASQWAVKKDGGVFDQFAGATITPRAVVKAVKGGLEFHERNRQAIYGAK